MKKRPIKKLLKATTEWQRLGMAIILVALIVGLGYVIRGGRAATIIGDVNGDGVVNITDLSLLISHWNANYAAADFNSDGTVNVLDLSALISHWGQTGSATPTPTATASPTPSSNFDEFVQVDGPQLYLAGQPFRFIGFNPAGIIGQCWSGDNWTTAQMDTYFASLPPNGMTRIFAVRNNQGGVPYVQSIVTEAEKYHQHLIIGLSDGNSACSDTDGAGTPGVQGSGKTLAFYQSGWKGNYLTWLNQLVPALKNSPAVAIWEIQNEPFHSSWMGGVTVVGQGIPLATAQSFVNGAAAAIRADDPNHLVSIAPAEVYDFGGSSDYQTLFANLDVLDFHDYSWDFDNGAVVSSDFGTVKQIAKNLGKPFMVDEAGVEGGSGCTNMAAPQNYDNPTFDTPQNVTGFSAAGRVGYLVNQKANDYLSTTGAGGAGGASGIVFWDYELAGQSQGPCSLEMEPTDPMINAVKNYQLPN